jgi:hypothetical protein
MDTTPTKLTGDRSQCAVCGLLFTSTSSFDRHRTGGFITGRRCRTVDELRTIGFEPNERGFWRKALTAEQRTQLNSLRSTITIKEFIHG